MSNSNVYNFDIIFNKKTDFEVFKLSNESEFHQLKLMICGKYKIYDLNKIFIYYNNILLNNNYAENTKLKNIFFNNKKIKIEVLLKKKQTKNNFNYFCSNCNNGAIYICDKCNEIICENCYKRKYHITHNKFIVKLNEYPKNLKKNLKNIAIELDNKIIKDEAYNFFQYLNEDIKNEIENINNLFEYLKSEIENIKNYQIEFLLNFKEKNTFDDLKINIENTLQLFATFDTNQNLNKIYEDKQNLINSSRNILNNYEELKKLLIYYTKSMKDIQNFNENFMNIFKDKYNLIKKKINGDFNSNFNNNINNLNNSINNNLNYSHSQTEIHSKNIQINLNNSSTFNNNNNNNFLNKSNSMIFNSENFNHNKYNNNHTFTQNSFSLNKSMQLKKKQSKNKLNSEKLLLKIKDNKKILIFNILNQNFKEKNYFDKSNFKKDFKSQSDLIQMNFSNNKLFILSGKKFNKLFYYDYYSNNLYFLVFSIYSHYLGNMIYCKKNSFIYLLGGNSQIHCERINAKNLNQMKTEKFKNIPPLNEDRQEFCSMYFKNYIYVFFGFSIKKGKNLNSIERININTHDKFEIIYINNEIQISQIGCCKFYNEENENNILLLGGFDGENYLDNCYVFNVDEIKLKDSEIIIPNINKHNKFLFQNESCFYEIGHNNKNIQILFDNKNNVHLISNDNYELFSEIK